jgi:hypothetical protein
MLKKEIHRILAIFKSDVLVQRVDSCWEIVDGPLITGMSLKDVHLPEQVRGGAGGGGGGGMGQTIAKLAIE